MDDMGGKFECKPWLELAYWQENKTENSFKMQFLIKVIFLKINLISKCQIFHKLHFRHFGSTLFVFKLFHSIFYSCFYLLHVYTISISPGKHFSIFRSLSQSSKEKKLWNDIQKPNGIWTKPCYLFMYSEIYSHYHLTTDFNLLILIFL